MLADISAKMNVNLRVLKEGIKLSKQKWDPQPVPSDLSWRGPSNVKWEPQYQSVRSELNETTACNEATETKPDPGMILSVEDRVFDR
jgi:hypothetical protein